MKYIRTCGTCVSRFVCYKVQNTDDIYRCKTCNHYHNENRFKKPVRLDRESIYVGKKVFFIDEGDGKTKPSMSFGTIVSINLDVEKNAVWYKVIYDSGITRWHSLCHNIFNNVYFDPHQAFNKYYAYCKQYNLNKKSYE